MASKRHSRFLPSPPNRLQHSSADLWQPQSALFARTSQTVAFGGDPISTYISRVLAAIACVRLCGRSHLQIWKKREKDPELADAANSKSDCRLLSGRKSISAARTPGARTLPHKQQLANQCGVSSGAKMAALKYEFLPYFILNLHPALLKPSTN